MGLLPPPATTPATESSARSATRPSSEHEVAILLCTYNGQAYLKQQIDSFLSQTHQKWTLYVSDDGSTDGTLALLEEYQSLIGKERIQVFSGPHAGFAENFMSLVRNQSIKADFFAFSDQDDIWFSEKLERSIRELDSLPAGRPAVYCSRTRLIDENRKIIGFSPLLKRAPAFQNALIQSIAGANTMLFNDAARTLLGRVPTGMTIIAHDWCIYLLTTAFDGTVIYDPEPTLDYRQHNANVIGASTSFKERIIRIGKLVDGRFKRWSDSNLRILELFEKELTSASFQTLENFRQARQSSIIQRLRLMKRSGVYRQTSVENIGLILAICLNKI